MKNVMKLFVFVIVLAVAAPAMAANSPLTIPGATKISTAKAKKLFDKGILFLDVRRNSDWDAGRIPGAKHLELYKVYTAKTLGSLIKKNEPIVIYCNGPECMRSSEATAKAVSWGYTKVYYFRGGFPAWKNAGLPVE